MTTLIIQIPCLNEAETLPQTLSDLPREIEGIDRVEWLIIDDGSTDGTAEVARAHGVHHIVKHTANYGLARAFQSGLDACLRLGADIIVNTDADNQYAASCIPALVRPICEGRADFVIGDRNTDQIEHFSWMKKRLQKVGSWVVRQASGTTVPDATSGFRALSRYAALRLNITSKFTYTLESLIQAGNKNIAIAAVPIRTNRKTRESRLFSNVFSYIRRSSSTIVRIYSVYRPMRAFLILGGALLLAGAGLGGRFLYSYVVGSGAGKIQSLLLAVILVVVGVQTILTGFLADLMGHNRVLLEDVLFRVRRLELDGIQGKNAQSDGARAAPARRDPPDPKQTAMRQG